MIKPQQLSLGFCGSLLATPRLPRDTLREEGMGQETWQQLVYIHGLGAELPSHVFNTDKQVYHSLNTQLSLGFSGSLLTRPPRNTL